MANVVIFDPNHSVVPGTVTQYLLSVNTPDYSGQPNTLINPTVPGVAMKYWKVDSSLVVEMSALEKDAVDLPGSKQSKIDGILAKTEVEEGEGVPYNNYHFSVTPSAKSNWLAIVVASAGLTYPFSAPTGFESIYEFQNQSDVQGFFMASMGFLKYWEESNESLIIAVEACTTCAQVEAIVDDRQYPPT